MEESTENDVAKPATIPGSSEEEKSDQPAAAAAAGRKKKLAQPHQRTFSTTSSSVDDEIAKSDQLVIAAQVHHDPCNVLDSNTGTAAVATYFLSSVQNKEKIVHATSISLYETE